MATIHDSPSIGPAGKVIHRQARNRELLQKADFRACFSYSPPRNKCALTGRYGYFYRSKSVREVPTILFFYRHVRVYPPAGSGRAQKENTAIFTHCRLSEWPQSSRERHDPYSQRVENVQPAAAAAMRSPESRGCCRANAGTGQSGIERLK